MYKPVWLDAQGRAVRRLGGAEQRLGRVEQRLGGAERLGRAEQRLSGVTEAVELCGAAELLGVPLTVEEEGWNERKCGQERDRESYCEREGKGCC